MIARAIILAAGLAGTTLTVVPAWIEHSPGFIWNASASAPIGLYRLLPADDLQLGDMVAIRPSEPLAGFLADRGYLARGVPLLKRVLAVRGQTVCREHMLISIDGIAVAPARAFDRLGRPLPKWQGCRRIDPDEVFLMNPAVPDSLDGRYFGPLPASSIMGRVVSLLTFEGE